MPLDPATVAFINQTITTTLTKLQSSLTPEDITTLEEYATSTFGLLPLRVAETLVNAGADSTVVIAELNDMLTFIDSNPSQSLAGETLPGITLLDITTSGSTTIRGEFAVINDATETAIGQTGNLLGTGSAISDAIGSFPLPAAGMEATATPGSLSEAFNSLASFIGTSNLGSEQTQISAAISFLNSNIGLTTETDLLNDGASIVVAIGTGLALNPIGFGTTSASTDPKNIITAINSLTTMVGGSTLTNIGLGTTVHYATITQAINALNTVIGNSSISGAASISAGFSTLQTDITSLQDTIGASVFSNLGSTLTAALGDTKITGASISAAISAAQSVIGTSTFSQIGSSLTEAVGDTLINIADGTLSGAIGSTALSSTISASIAAIQNQIATVIAGISDNGDFADIELLSSTTSGSSTVGGEFSAVIDAVETAIGQTIINIEDGTLSGAIGSTALTSSISDSIAALQIQVNSIPVSSTDYAGIELLGSSTSGSTSLYAEFTALTGAIETAIGQTDVGGALSDILASTIASLATLQGDLTSTQSTVTTLNDTVGSTSFANVGADITTAIGNTSVGGSLSDILASTITSLATLQEQVDTILISDTAYASIELLGSSTSGSTVISAEFTALTEALETAIGQTKINIADSTISGAIGSTTLSSSISASILALQSMVGTTTNLLGLSSSITAAIGSTAVTGGSLSSSVATLESKVGTTTDLLGLNSSITAAIGTTAITGGTLSSSIATLQGKVGTSSLASGATITSIIGSSTLFGTGTTITSAIGDTSLPIAYTSLSNAISEISTSLNSLSGNVGYNSNTNLLQAGFTVAQAIGQVQLVTWGIDDSLSSALSNVQSVIGIDGNGNTPSLLNAAQSIVSAIGANTIITIPNGDGSISSAIGDTTLNVGSDGTITGAIGSATINGDSLSDAISTLQTNTDIISTGQPSWDSLGGNNDGGTSSTYQSHAFYTCTELNSGIGTLVAGATSATVTSAYLMTAYAQCAVWANSATSMTTSSISADMVTTYSYLLDSNTGTCIELIDDTSAFTSAGYALAKCMWGVYH